MKLRRKISEKMYSVAIRKRSDGNDFFWEHEDYVFQEIKINCKGRYWLADPFLFEKDSKVYIFYEAFDLVQRKGKIGYSIIDDKKKSIPVHIVLDEPYHLSFPNVFVYQDNIYMEMVGVTNMTGVPVTIQDGVVTTLIDLAGADVQLTLPGGVRVGASEETVKAAFPEFVDRPLDGIADFRGNELLYACNVRDDGCNGYALIKNDPPYYSALTIICKEGVIQEISFECLGPDRAQGVFLEEDGT